MPELPEVQTTVDGINAEVTGKTIIAVWTDYGSAFHAGKNNIKNPIYFKKFSKDVIGTNIAKAERQGKNVLIHLSDWKKNEKDHKTTKNHLSAKNHTKTMLVHMKMTGHFMYGDYVFDKKTNVWEPRQKDGPLRDPYNKHIHLVFGLSDGKYLVFSDLRKFAKVFLFDTEHRHTIEDLMHLGPDPLSKDFNYKLMVERLATKAGGKIKQVLMDQSVLSGIGNIYSDEMLWKAGIHPLSKPSTVPVPALKLLYTSMKEVLEQGIDFGGDSDSDYRNIYGEPGKYQHRHNAYRRTGEPCPKRGCKGIIERMMIGGRSSHFCPVHQKLYK